MVRRLPAGLLGLAIAAGCTGNPSTPPKPTRSTKVEPTPPAAASPVASPGAASPAPLASSSPAPSPSPAVAKVSALVGLVKGPASLISDQGGGLISDQGAELISDQGAELISDQGGGILGKTKLYRLAATLEQQPLPGLTVQLLDGAGKPIQTTTTDAQGRYAFDVALPASNWFVQAALPKGRGTLAAIVPKTGEQRTVDVDLVSSLTTGYIYDQYVRDQADRQATLDKLPPEVEAETRAKAQAALGSGVVALPDALSPRRVVETVNSLRQGDAAFNDQMETVKRLLIAAGQSDLGNGRKATEVALSAVRSLTLAPDGTLYITCSFDRRVWRLGTDGLLATAVGNGRGQNAGTGFDAEKLDRIDGLKGPDASLIAIRGVAFDDQGRLLVLEYPGDIVGVIGAGDASLDTGGIGRVSRLEPDGKLSQLWLNSMTGKAVAPGPDGETLVVVAGFATEASKVVAIKPDKTRVDVHTFTTAESVAVKHTEAFGHDARGRIYLGKREYKDEPAAVYRFDPASKQLELVADQAKEGWKGLALDCNGAIVYLDGAGKLMARRPDGPALTLLERPPAEVALTMFTGVALKPDGALYLRIGTTHVVEVAKGALKPVAGAAAGGSGEGVALADPQGVAAGADGVYYVADRGKHEVLRFTADRQATVFAGTGTAGYGGEGVKAAETPLSSPRSIRLDGQGNLYVVERAPALDPLDKLDSVGKLEDLCNKTDAALARVRKITPAGLASTVFSSADKLVIDLAVAADGTLYVSLADPCSAKGSLVKQTPAGTQTTLIPESAGHRSIPALCLGPAGEIFLAASNKLHKYADGALTPLPAKGWVPGSEYYACTMAADDVGRLYISQRINDRVIRYSPGTNTYEGIAGPNSFNFTGSTVDDSIKDARYPTFAPDGTLYFTDWGHKQVKRLPADKLVFGMPETLP